MKSKNKANTYQEESHKLALKHLYEKFQLEYKYNKNITLETLINEIHNNEVFSMNEYIEIYNKIKNNYYNK